MPAFAQTQPKQFDYPIACWPEAELPDMLGEKYKEIPTGQGLSNNGVLFQLYESDESWTLIFLDPQRQMGCMFGAGDDWMSMLPASF